MKESDVAIVEAEEAKIESKTASSVCDDSTKQHVVALSGGKDSTAMALALQYFEPRNYLFIKNPTGNELPEMDAHFARLEELFGTKFYTVGCGLTFEELIYREQAIPNFRWRFCSRVLKIEPTQEFFKQLEDPILYVGLRADEKKREGIDYGVECRFPLREWGWTIHDVRRFLRINSVSIPKRTDCALCFWQRLDEWWFLWKYYPDYWKQGEQIEEDLGHTFRTPGKDTWPTSLRDMRKKFEAGHAPKKAETRQSLMDKMDSEKCPVCIM